MRYRRLFVSSVSVAAILAAGLGYTASATPDDLASRVIAGLEAVQLPGAADLGPATATGEEVSLVLASRDEQGLSNYVATPHRPLSSQEFAARFGPSPEAVNQVRSWATSAGLTVLHDPGSQLVKLSGTTNQIGSAFSTSMHRYRLGEGSYIAASTAGKLPASLASVTTGVVGLSAPTKMDLASSGTKKAGLLDQLFGTSYDPASLTGFYQAPESVAGKGQEISIIGEGDLSQVSKDLVTFEDKFHLPHVPLHVLPVDGGSSDRSGDEEWALDTQYSTAFAPAVSAIDFYAGRSLEDRSVLNTVTKWVDDDKTKQASASLGECEDGAEKSGLRASLDAVLKKAVAQGQTLFASSGDTGSRCGTSNGTVAGPKGVSYPASSPYAVGVGGTTITDYNRHQESAWYASGGGESQKEPAPDWQKDVGGAYKPTSRGVPDVALDSDGKSGFQIIANGQPTVAGGTSAAAPSWNGIWARAQELHGSQLGFAAPMLYQLPASAFNEITKGNNGDYTAGPGWNYVTGRGTPNITALVTQIKPTR